MQRPTIFLFRSVALFALVMAALPQPVAIPGNPSDKLLHIAAFAVLALLAPFAYPRARLIVILLALPAFGGFIELVQTIPALNRHADWIDWMADTLAATFVLSCIFLLRRIATRPSAPDA